MFPTACAVPEKSVGTMPSTREQKEGKDRDDAALLGQDTTANEEELSILRQS